MYSNLTIAVIGDYCEDRWHEAESIGICPGTTTVDIRDPKLILKKPGMAGNIFANIKALGAKGDLYPPATQLLGHKKDYYSYNGSSVSRISTHPEFSTEECYDERSLLLQRLSEYDAVIIADYNKGWVTDAFVDIIERCNDADISVMVDPKFERWDAFEGATIFKPNLEEWNDQPHDSWSKNVSLSLHVVVTRGDDGIWVMFPKGYEHIPGHKVGVADHTGAGDTCMAVLTLEYLRTGGDILQAAKLANIAGSLVVQHRYTACTTVDALKEAGGYQTLQKV